MQHMHLFFQIKYMVTKTAGRISMVPWLWFQLKNATKYIERVLHLWFTSLIKAKSSILCIAHAYVSTVVYNSCY